MIVLRFALVGDPVEHSRSPAIQTAALGYAGLAGSYELIRADLAALDRVLERLRNGDLDGVNVTMPLKLAALERSDVATEEATASRSANTLRIRDGELEAHSTDVVAFREIFTQVPEAAPLLVLGAGASARAAVLGWSGGEAYVSARDPQRVGDLGLSVPWGSGVAGAVVVNATPLGMGGESLSEEVVGPAAALIDLPYGRSETPSVRAARRAGKTVFDGLDFLARQGAASFKWWTGVDVDSNLLAAAARKV